MQGMHFPPGTERFIRRQWLGCLQTEQTFNTYSMGWQDWIFDAYQVGSDERRVVSAVISLVYGFVYVLSFSTIKPPEKHKKNIKRDFVSERGVIPPKKKLLVPCSMLS
jgi:hypothetical protein